MHFLSREIIFHVRCRWWCFLRPFRRNKGQIFQPIAQAWHRNEAPKSAFWFGSSTYRLHRYRCYIGTEFWYPTLLGWVGIQSTSTGHWGSSGISFWITPLLHIHYITGSHHTSTWYLLPLLSWWHTTLALISTRWSNGSCTHLWLPGGHLGLDERTSPTAQPCKDWASCLPCHSKSNQIKSLLLSHHHSTSALVSEILMSVLQTVQKNNRQFTYGQTVQKTALEHLQCSRQCKKKKQQFTYGQTVQKNNKQFTYGQTVQKNNSDLHMDSTYLQTVQKTMCKIHIHILSTLSVL